jgi:hypothetical protein
MNTTSGHPGTVHRMRDGRVLPLIPPAAPMNIDAERALLAALLHGVIMAHETAIAAEHFAKNEHAYVFGVMSSLSVVDDILMKNRIDEPWWPALFEKLVAHPPIARSNALSYAEEIREMWMRRQVRCTRTMSASPPWTGIRRPQPCSPWRASRNCRQSAAR